MDYWAEKQSEGHFNSIKEEIEDNSEGDYIWKYM
jgi:hypothetical protein